MKSSIQHVGNDHHQPLQNLFINDQQNTNPQLLTPQQHLKKLNKQELLFTIEKLIKEERRITSEILECLREIESRLLYAELGYASLYEFCVKHLHYSEGSAHRRISAMRVLKNLPPETRKSAEEKIKNGSLTVSNLSLMHGFIQQAKKQKIEFKPEQKSALLQQIENQSKREAEKKLFEFTPEIEHRTEIRFQADPSLLQKLTRVKEITAHKIQGSDMGEILHRLADEYLLRHDPDEQPRRTQKTESKKLTTATPNTSPATKRCEKSKNTPSRYIPASVKHLVWTRDQGRCTFKTKTHTCGSRYGLEFEHLHPFALGGTHQPENITLRCRTHNQWSAIQMGLIKK